MAKIDKKEKIERLVIKLPKSVADNFRSLFPHGQRSNFVARCVLNYKQELEIKKIEEDLRKAGRNRQKNQSL